MHLVMDQGARTSVPGMRQGGMNIIKVEKIMDSL